MLRNRRVQIAMLACGLALTAWACSRNFPDVWQSVTTGKQYYVRKDKNHLYAQWVNLPPEAAKHGAYIHTACTLTGSKWTGTSEIYMPCTTGEGKDEKIANTCHLKLQIEFYSVGHDQIKGRGQTLKKFNCNTCQVIETGWKDFEWVPAS
jgi:hypothetical protein